MQRALFSHHLEDEEGETSMSYFFSLLMEALNRGHWTSHHKVNKSRSKQKAQNNLNDLLRNCKFTETVFFSANLKSSNGTLSSNFVKGGVRSIIKINQNSVCNLQRNRQVVNLADCTSRNSLMFRLKISSLINIFRRQPEPTRLFEDCDMWQSENI